MYTAVKFYYLMFKIEKTKVQERNMIYIQPYTGKDVKHIIQDPGCKSYVVLDGFIPPLYHTTRCYLFS